MTLLALQQACIGYPGVVVLDDVNLAVEAGDYVGLVGANGSGKTTLLRTLLGVQSLLEGSLQRGSDFRLGYVPQQMNLDSRFPLSVWEVVHMGLFRPGNLLTRTPPADQAFAESCLERVQMAHRRQALFHSLSGGQKQRVLMARALAAKPTLLLLDEPLAGVDAKASEIVMELLDEVHQEGCAVLLVTHNPLHLRDRATSLWVLRHGKVEAASLQDLLSPEGLAAVLQ